MIFKLALVQMRVEGGGKAANLDRAEKRIAEAGENGADIALLPEALDAGWTHPSSQTEAAPVPGGEACERLADAAAQSGIFVCGGLTELDGDNVYNSAVILDRTGQLICKHRKLNELDIGHQFYAQGDRLNVVETELGTLGLMICADGFARDHVLSRSLCYMGAQVILSPAAWAVPGDHDNDKQPYGDTWRKAYVPVALEFGVWIAGASNVGNIEAGPWAGRKCIGCSYVVDPEGNEVIQGPYGADAETILYVDVRPRSRPARGNSWPDYWASATKGKLSG